MVVCGAFNVRAGPLQLHSLRLARLSPNGQLSKKTKLRGEVILACYVQLRAGMTDESEGTFELEDNAPRVPARIGLLLDDNTCIDLTPNVQIVFSIVGVAREIAAINQLSIKAGFPIRKLSRVWMQLYSIQIDNKEVCPYYSGRTIRNINSNAITHQWMVGVAMTLWHTCYSSRCGCT